MFGMLDYRAHKLFRLLTLPFLVMGKILFFIAIAGAVAIAQWSKYPPILKIVVGYVAFEAIGFLLYFIWAVLMWMARSAFFWIVDVIPSKGSNEEEAREIVLKGRVVWLLKKLVVDIENWTYEDTRSFVSAMNWRAKLFFNAREKFETRICRLKHFYEETGRQPGLMTVAEMSMLLGDLDGGWLEKAIVHQHFFNAIVAISLIALAVLYLTT